MKTILRLNRVDAMFRAFADPTRLRILHLLRRGETCVCDLIEVLRVPQAKVSRHLAYLRRAGLVQVRKQGQWCYYCLAPAETAFHRNLLACVGACFVDVPEIKADARRAERVSRDDNGCAETGDCCDE